MYLFVIVELIDVEFSFIIYCRTLILCVSLPYINVGFMPFPGKNRDQCNGGLISFSDVNLFLGP